MPEEAAGVEQSVTQSAGSTHDVSLEEPVEQAASLSPVGDSGGNGREQSVQGSVKDKKPSAYYQIRQAKKAFKAEQEAFAKQREAFAQERAEFEEARKPRRDYTLGDLQKYRRQWENEGNFELVEAADKEIAVIKAEQEAEKKASVTSVDYPVAGTPEHRAQWEAAERELFAADPEFMRAGTRLDGRLREIMGSEDGNIYRSHPRGIIAAYHRARMELLESDLKGIRDENSKLQNELKRYQGLTGIGSGAPAQLGTGSRVESVRDFERLTTKDMRKHLLANADKHGVPWF